MADSVKFDPGLGELTVNFNEYINNIYSQMLLLKQFNQKKIKFKMHVPKIKQYMKNCISFYAGCLLWAYHIYNQNINDPKTIEGNEFLHMPKEIRDEYDYLIQINFMENYFECFERDTLYYTGKKEVIPEKWINILNLYKEFLKLNNGFLDTEKTSDIILPEKLKNINFNFDINALINKSIKEKNLDIITDVENLPL